MTGRARGNKYGAVRTMLDGITFDSKREAAVYADLKLRHEAGEIGEVELQKPFPLLAPSGEIVGIYKADFAFWDFKENRLRVWDVKGFDTPLSKWKRKHVRAQYAVEVEVVK